MLILYIIFCFLKLISYTFRSIDFDEGLEEFKTIAKSSPKAEPVRKIAKPAVK